jgi:hypothetical protein
MSVSVTVEKKNNFHQLRLLFEVCGSRLERQQQRASVKYRHNTHCIDRDWNVTIEDGDSSNMNTEAYISMTSS